MRNSYTQVWDYNSYLRIPNVKISLIVSALLVGTTLLHASPSNGTVMSGSATITQNGTITNINQSTQKASINWSTFSIGSNETVNFNQPNVSSITLNRVVGNEKSVIDGALNANGQVWILNSNGVLFNKNASINTSGLLATTKSLSDADFQAGNYTFTGDSKANIINLGTIDIANSGYAALLANTVSNEGTIKAIKGTIELVGGDAFNINLNGNSLVNLTVTKGVLDALVENKGALIANGGEIYLTTNAVNDLLKGVVNNTGVIEAQTLNDITGKIELYAHGGEVKVGGTLLAESGFIETSGKEFSIDPVAKIIAGEWLIDPVNITIDTTLANAIMTALGSGNVTISTDGSNTPSTSSGESGSAGDINVNSAITWSSNKTLTLSAFNDININANLTHTGTSAGGIIFLYGQGTSDGGSSKYTLNSGATVTSPSLQWRKGSDLSSTRYAIVNGDVFLGNKYIEIGINSSAGGKFGTTSKPSLFFGRQGGLSGIGMTGDADGFGTGADLRIDYFLPGSPYEAFSAKYDISGIVTTATNFVTLANSGKIELLPLGADNILTAKVTTTLSNNLKVEQLITLGVEKKYFDNQVTLTNVGSSTLNNVAFVRSFDPDNTVDIGGSYVTTQKIEQRVSEGDAATVVSATSQAGDAYSTRAGGAQSKIIYYSTDERSNVGFGSAFFGGTITNMLTTAAGQTKGATTTGDIGMGIILSAGTLATGSSATFNYFTSLDNRDMSVILSELEAAAKPIKIPTPTTPPSVISAIVNNTAVEQPRVVQTFTPQYTTNSAPLTTYVRGGESITLASTTGNENANTLVSLSEIRQMQRASGTPSGTTEQSTSGETTGVDASIRVPLSRGSLIDIVNGGVKLPENVEQEFYVLNQTQR